MSVVEVIKRVLVSWQVIVVTLVIVVYFSLVSYTARRYHRPKSAKSLKVNLFKKKKAKSADASLNPNAADSDSGSVDELGIEEA
jgi:anionic cell wall polymer biosynthesis LytR-Cps2A-Psr (LCP) family protein